MNARADHIWLIAKYSMRYSIRTGGGLMYLIVLLISALTIGAMIEESVKGFIGEGSDSPSEMLDQILQSPAVKGAVSGITGVDAKQSDYLLVQRPALLSALLILLLMIIPYSACLGGFNQTSGDIASKGLRFLLLRTERINVYLGRLLGVSMFTVVAAAAVLLLIVFYVHFKFGIYGFWPLFSWGLEGLLAMLMLSLPYLAFCAWISGKIDSPFVSLVICLLAAGFPVIFIMLLKAMIAARTTLTLADLDWMMRILPWGWKNDLLDHRFGTRLIAGAAMLGFTGLFLSLGIRSFNRRDL